MLRDFINIEFINCLSLYYFHIVRFNIPSVSNFTNHTSHKKKCIFLHTFLGNNLKL